MKTFLLLAASLLSFSAAQAKITIITDEKAYITVCQKGMAGCVDKIVVNGKSYQIEVPDRLTDVRDLVDSLIAANRFHKQSRTTPFKVEGYTTTVTGRMPNPTATFDAFVITSLEGVLMPKNAPDKKNPAVLKDEKAVIGFCLPGMLGCTESITVNGKSYLLAVDPAKTDISARIKNLINSSKFHRLTKSGPLAVEGYVKKESGRFPNPAAEFEVFYITSIGKIVIPAYPR